MKIGIIPNKDKDKNLKITKRLIKSIKDIGLEYLIDNTLYDINIGAKIYEEELLKKSDILISLGGDGSFLNVARKACKYNKPVLGINLGSLGFLTEIEVTEIEESLLNLKRNKFSIEERMMLSLKLIRDNEIIESNIALNDISISRGELSRILHLKIFIDGVYFNSFPGDGLIVSSPTGSTAYSLSAGGPIVEPDTELFIITPICSHSLNSRPLITACNKVIKVIVDEKYAHKAMMTVDGQIGYHLRGGDIIEIKRAKETIKFIKMKSRNFYDILNSKIYYR